MDEEKEVPVIETDEQRAEKIENLLMTEGVMIPGNDLVHYMTRNASYMKLINSQEFLDSGIKLEELLDDSFIEEQFKANAETARMMRFVTEKVVTLMQELTTGLPNEATDATSNQPELEGLDIPTTVGTGGLND